MKGDLISRNALIQRIVVERDAVVTDNHYDVGYNNGLSMAYAMAYNAPAVEAEPVVHGRWILNVAVGYDCSCCGKNNSGFNCKPNYCPNCGAKMDGGENDVR